MRWGGGQRQTLSYLGSGGGSPRPPLRFLTPQTREYTSGIDRAAAIVKRKFQNLIRFGLALRDAGDAALISVLDDLTLDLPSAWEGSLHFLAAPVTSPDSVDTDDINATQELEKPRFKDNVAFVMLPHQVCLVTCHIKGIKSIV